MNSEISWLSDAPPEFYDLSKHVQEGLAFEAHCLATTVGELMAAGVHKVYIAFENGTAIPVDEIAPWPRKGL